MVIYVKNNYDPVNNKKNLTIARKLIRSTYYMDVEPGETCGPLELGEIDDLLDIRIAPDSPTLECVKNSRITFDECLDNHVEITPPSVMIDYPHSIDVPGNRSKFSITAGRHDWRIKITHPEKEVDRWIPGLKPGTYPQTVNVIIGEDVDVD